MKKTKKNVIGLLLSILGILSGGLVITINNKSCNRTTIYNIPNEFEEYKFSGRDSSGNTLEFIMLVTAERRWWKKKVDSLEGSILLLKDFFREIGMNQIKNLQSLNYEDFVCIGTASHEGTTEDEENRAGIRSERLREQMVVNGISGKVYKLNLGKYLTDTDAIHSSEQRRIMIVGIAKENRLMTPIQLKQAIWDGLKNKLPKSVKLNIEDYSKGKYQNFELLEGF